MSLFLIVALPFLGALLPGLMNQAGRAACGGITFTVTLSAFIGLLTNAPAVFSGEVVTAGVDLAADTGSELQPDARRSGFFFALLILGIGLLIITYGRYYLSRDDNMGEFSPICYSFRARWWASFSVITFCFCWFSGS